MFLEEIYMQDGQQRHFFYGPFATEESVEAFKLFLKQRLEESWGDAEQDIQNLVKFIHLDELPGDDLVSFVIEDVFMWLKIEDFERLHQPQGGTYVEIVLVQDSSSSSNGVEMFAGPFLSEEDRQEYIRRSQDGLGSARLNPHASKYISCDGLPRGKRWAGMYIVGELAEGLESKPVLFVRSFPKTPPKKE